MIIVLNNKCNLSKDDFLKYQIELEKVKSNYDIVLCPTYLNINLFNLNKIHLGSQNISAYDDGAYTGEISAQSLKKSNVEYTIIGHSERRKYQKETNKEINEKIKKALEKDIIPILCVGETKEERQLNKVEDILKKDLLEAVQDLKPKELNKIIIAYEPIWSIGTGLIPTNLEIEEVNNYIKKLFPNNMILYGGSANEENIDIINKCKSIDGYLLGGLSLHPDKLQKFINKL